MRKAPCDSTCLPSTRQYLKRQHGPDPVSEPGHVQKGKELSKTNDKIRQLREIMRMVRSSGAVDNFPYEPNYEPVGRDNPQQARERAEKMRKLMEIKVSDAELRHMIENTPESEANLQRVLEAQSRIPITNIKEAVGTMEGLSQPEGLGEDSLTEIMSVLAGLKFTVSQRNSLQKAIDQVKADKAVTSSQRAVLNGMLTKVVEIEGSIETFKAPNGQEDEYHNLRQFTLPAIKNMISALLDFQPTLRTKEGPDDVELNRLAGVNPLRGVPAGQPQMSGDPVIDAQQQSAVKQEPEPVKPGVSPRGDPVNKPGLSVQSLDQIDALKPESDGGLNSEPVPEVGGIPLPPPPAPTKLTADDQVALVIRAILSGIEKNNHPELVSALESNGVVMDNIFIGLAPTPSGVKDILSALNRDGKLSADDYNMYMKSFKSGADKIKRIRAKEAKTSAPPLSALPLAKEGEEFKPVLKPTPVTPPKKTTSLTSALSDALTTRRTSMKGERKNPNPDPDDNDGDWDVDDKPQGKGVRGFGVKNYSKAKKLVVDMNTGKFGKLRFNVKKLKNMELKAYKGRKMVASGTMAPDLYDLLTKQRVMKGRGFSEESLNLYRRLCELAEIPRTLSGQSGKGKLLEGRVKPGKPPKTPTADDLFEEFQKLVGSIQAGNKAKQLVSKASDVLDKLKSMGAITARQYEQLFDNLV